MSANNVLERKINCPILSDEGNKAKAFTKRVLIDAKSDSPGKENNPKYEISLLR